MCCLCVSVEVTIFVFRLDLHLFFSYGLYFAGSGDYVKKERNKQTNKLTNKEERKTNLLSILSILF